MKVTVNLRLARQDAQRLVGELPPDAFNADIHDELVHLSGPVEYDLEAEMHAENLLVQGRLYAPLRCTCGRCLKEYEDTVELDEFAALAPVTGEDALTQEGDLADLTPLVREDIFLALPANPLCSPKCRGLSPRRKTRDSRLQEDGPAAPSPWSQLDKLKL